MTRTPGLRITNFNVQTLDCVGYSRLAHAKALQVLIYFWQLFWTGPDEVCRRWTQIPYYGPTNYNPTLLPGITAPLIMPLSVQVSWPSHVTNLIICKYNRRGE